MEVITMATAIAKNMTCITSLPRYVVLAENFVEVIGHFDRDLLHNLIDLQKGQLVLLSYVAEEIEQPTFEEGFVVLNIRHYRRFVIRS